MNNGSAWSNRDRILSYKAAKIEKLRQQKAAKTIEKSVNLAEEVSVSTESNSIILKTENPNSDYSTELSTKFDKISLSSSADNGTRSTPAKSLEKLPEQNSNDSFSEYEDCINTDNLNKLQFPQFPLNGTNIMITSVVRSNFVYIRSMSHNIEYFQGIHLIHHQGKKAVKLNKMPNRGDIVIAQFKDYSFYRALVLNTCDSKRITLVYIDFGNVEEKSLNELYKAIEIVKKLPCYILPVYLKNVDNILVTREIKSELDSWVFKTELKCVYEGTMSAEGPYICDIFDWQESQSLSEKINIIRKSLPPTERFQFYFEPEVVSIEGTNIPLIILDRDTIQETKMITCIRKSDIYALQQFNKEIDYFVKQNKTECYTPRVGEVCLAQTTIDGRWYRGSCVEVLGDGHPTIQFIDFGNFSPIHITRIRQYPRYFNFPIFSFDCEIFGLPCEISNKLSDRLKELIPAYSHLVADEIYSTPDKEMNVARFDKILETIKSEDLLCS